MHTWELERILAGSGAAVLVTAWPFVMLHVDRFELWTQEQDDAWMAQAWDWPDDLPVPYRAVTVGSVRFESIQEIRERLGGRNVVYYEEGTLRRRADALPFDEGKFVLRVAVVEDQPEPDVLWDADLRRSSGL